MLHIDTQRARLADTKQDFKNAGIDPVGATPGQVDKQIIKTVMQFLQRHDSGILSGSCR